MEHFGDTREKRYPPRAEVGVRVWELKRGEGEEGGGRIAHIQPEFLCSGQVDAGGLLDAFHVPWVGIWLCEAAGGWGVDKGQLPVPGSQTLASHAGYGRGAENRIGDLE